jgi:hypothetical protein
VSPPLLPPSPSSPSHSFHPYAHIRPYVRKYVRTYCTGLLAGAGGKGLLHRVTGNLTGAMVDNHAVVERGGVMRQPRLVGICKADTQAVAFAVAGQKTKVTYTSHT